MMRVILVRHGRTAWNREERFRGRPDIPLDDVGEAQVDACGRAVALRFRPSAVFASPLGRSLRTAEAIGRRLGLPVQAHDGLIDMSFGKAEGLTWAEADARFAGLGSTWRDAPHMASFPGGESLPGLRVRIVAAVREIAGAQAGEEIVLVGHNATNRVLLLEALGLGDERFWRFGQEPAAVNVLALAGESFTVVTLNDTCHLNHMIPIEEKTK
jgi:broad specificity phosphatase PhoE